MFLSLAESTFLRIHLDLMVRYIDRREPISEIIMLFSNTQQTIDPGYISQFFFAKVFVLFSTVTTGTFLS